MKVIVSTKWWKQDCAAVPELIEIASLYVDGKMIELLWTMDIITHNMFYLFHCILVLV